MTATVHQLTKTAAAPVEDYEGFSLTYYRKHSAVYEGVKATVPTADELLDSYIVPQWLSATAPIPETAKQAKDASPCVTAALMAPGEPRSHRAAGLSRVLFVDFDMSSAGTEGMQLVEAEGLLAALKKHGKSFVLHTTTSTPYLEAGRLKLRAVFPLLEPCLPSEWTELWKLVAEHVREHTGIVADATKTHPGDLTYVPVFHPQHESSWASWREVSEHLLCPYRAASLTDGSIYDKLRNAKDKDDVLFRVAYRAGATDDAALTLSSDADVDAYIEAEIWPQFERGLRDNTVSAPVKDWNSARAKVFRKFHSGLQQRLSEQATKSDARKVELLAELRAGYTEVALVPVMTANGRTCKAACGQMERLGSLLAADLGMPADELQAAKDRVRRTAEGNTTAAKQKLLAALQTGLSKPVDPRAELQSAAARVSWEDMGLILQGEESTKPQTCATNVALLFMKDPNLAGLFKRNVRSLSDDFIVQRDFMGLVAGQVFALSTFAGFDWFRKYAGQKRAMADLTFEDYDSGVRAVLNALPVVDPLVAYFEGLPASSGPEATEQLDSFFVRHGGAEDSELTRGVTRALFMSAVRTVFEPGAPTNLVWVLLGEQGLGKTLILESLCPSAEYCGKIAPSEIGGSKNNDQGRKPVNTAGRCFLVEVPELKLRGDSVEDWKGFISDFSPCIRLPYLKGERVVPRRSVLVATSNNLDLFKDPTGNRRFPTLELLKRVDLQAVRAERDALWAEALRLYRLSPSETGIPESLWSAAAERVAAYVAVEPIEDLVSKLTKGLEAWPEPSAEPPVYAPLIGLRKEWQHDGNNVPKVLSLHQWERITGCKNDNKLRQALRTAKWFPESRRTFLNSGQQLRAWVHPDYRHLL